MNMLILGVDPGHKESHAVLIRAPLKEGPGARVELVGAYAIDMGDADAALGEIPDLAGVHVAAVEVARGEVHSGRSGDGVLLNNFAAGVLAGSLAARGAPTIVVPPAGNVTPWAWRPELGAANNDDAVEVMVRRYLDGELPEGPRGGRVAHWYDAAGIAIATWRRAAHHGWKPGERLAFVEPTPLEAAALERRANYRAARRGRPRRKR